MKLLRIKIQNKTLNISKSAERMDIEIDNLILNLKAVCVCVCIYIYIYIYIYI